MVRILIVYKNSNDSIEDYTTDPLSIEDALNCVKRFVDNDYDTIARGDLEKIQILFAHRITGMWLIPVSE